MSNDSLYLVVTVLGFLVFIIFLSNQELRLGAKLSKEEKEEMEAFLSVSLLNEINNDELAIIFKRILNEYLGGVEIPRSFLVAICKNSNHFMLFHSTSSLEMDRCAEFVKSDGVHPGMQSNFKTRYEKVRGLIDTIESINSHA